MMRQSFYTVMAFAVLFAMPLAAGALDDARHAIIAEDFSRARALLLEAPETEERNRLQRVLGECELHSLCERAEGEISDKPDQALKLLESAVAAQTAERSSNERARGLAAIARAKSAQPDTAGDKFIKEFDAVLKSNKEYDAKRLAYVKQVVDLVDQSLSRAGEALVAADTARKTRNDSTVFSGYDTVCKECLNALELIKKLENYIDRSDYLDHLGRTTTRSHTLMTGAALGAGEGYFDIGDYGKAIRWAEDGLKYSPSNTQLLELRVRIEELWKLDIFKDREE